ncbi:hypothetical protein [Fictibacillus sp. FJAT-27399]|uniref:hypothetical protein n=1 Tax=Fictibacillus sp. FJAT-27399 TaxID=1729689 RepID=UPI00078095E0|nr:hypothetical protein [Fictibacillus sp. FJAT-27399]
MRQMIKRALDTPLFFYNAINGVAATATIDADGIYNYVSQISGLGTRTHVVGSANGTLFFYNANIGEAATATLDPGGNYRYVGSISGFGRWTHITGTSNGSVLFYNAYTGEGELPGSIPQETTISSVPSPDLGAGPISLRRTERHNHFIFARSSLYLSFKPYPTILSYFGKRKQFL